MMVYQGRIGNNLAAGTCRPKECPVIHITGVFKHVITQSTYLKCEHLSLCCLVTVWAKVHWCGRWPRHHCWKEIIKMQDWNLPKCLLTSQGASGRMSFGQIRQDWSFLPSLISKIKLPEKRTLSYSEAWRRLSDVLGLLRCIWHRVTWICAGYHEISRLLRHSVLQCVAQWQRAWS